LGEWAIERAAVSFDLASHWTEWFDPDLVWGARWVLVFSLVEYVLLAPFFEELVFRGLLYGTLRRRFAPGPAALISGMLFAVAHGYGLLGFCSVLWSGLLWAWAYEKTGSLWPGMTAHAISNLIVCLTVIALLRW
jgi:membrane protease YdiL (CAAX protease family)